MVRTALKVLQQGHPAWTFVMYDCARPRSVQLIMWDVVKGTPQQGYVANPHTPPGSIHNTGCADRAGAATGLVNEGNATRDYTIHECWNADLDIVYDKDIFDVESGIKDQCAVQPP